MLDKGKFYDIIEAEKGSQELTQDQIKWGLDNLNKPSKDFLMYLDKKIKIMEHAISLASKKQRGIIKNDLDEIIKLRENLARRLK